MIARLVWPRVKFSEAEREGLRDLVVRPPKLVLPALQVFSTEISTHVVRILRVKMASWHIWPPAIFIRSYLRTLHIFFEEGNKKARICRDKENYWRKGNIHNNIWRSRSRHWARYCLTLFVRACVTWYRRSDHFECNNNRSISFVPWLAKVDWPKVTYFERRDFYSCRHIYEAPGSWGLGWRTIDGRT